MEKEHKIGSGIMASYGVGKFLAEFLTGAFGAVVFKFYETEIGLTAGYAALATIIYSLWNAVNDPVIGYITNRKAPLSRLLGRRFPWIIIGLISSAVFFVLIFSVPESWRLEVRTNPLPVFLWMVLTICLYDGCYSLWEVNYQSVYPDKFRSQEIRTKAAAISTAVGVLGVAAGFVIPPLFFSYGDVGSYNHHWSYTSTHSRYPREQRDDLAFHETSRTVENRTKEGTCLSSLYATSFTPS